MTHIQVSSTARTIISSVIKRPYAPYAPTKRQQPLQPRLQAHQKTILKQLSSKNAHEQREALKSFKH